MKEFVNVDSHFIIALLKGGCAQSGMMCAGLSGRHAGRGELSRSFFGLLWSCPRQFIVDQLQ
jgi:hypothetical protein